MGRIGGATTPEGKAQGQGAKLQLPSSNHQRNSKLQASNRVVGPFAGPARSGWAGPSFLDFEIGIWLGFGTWNLGFCNSRGFPCRREFEIGNLTPLIALSLYSSSRQCRSRFSY